MIEVGNTFRKLDNMAFTLSGSLTCIVEDGLIKFRSFSNLRSIFNLIGEAFRAATEPEVRAFAAHQNLYVVDVDQFVSTSDEVMRRLIHAITDTSRIEPAQRNCD